MAKKQAQRSSIDNRDAKLIEQLTPGPPLPYSPALMELVAEHDRQAWGKFDELRRTLYSDALPWYGEALANAWVAKLRVSQSGDEKAIKAEAEKLRELEMRADREWSELLSVKPIVSFDTLADARAEAAAAGYPGTDAGLRAWNRATLHTAAPKPPSPETDGPCGIYQWRHNGVVVDGAIPKQQWEMAARLFEKCGEWVPFDHLIGTDKPFPDDLTDDQAIAAAGRKLSAWFRQGGIPLKVSSSTVERRASLLKTEE